ncbi:hypothetical protein M153_1000126364 [Pseudoloma neurophilia]|uniref:Uncharacterized protein n=1 Tax=Pseudoloma neurophilia TaxID=146866 RepID=A0A0R0M1L4_9MICR|nr:hypothetical protein M153_1000126364 [Pseudoloma neurophilia]
MENIEIIKNKIFLIESMMIENRSKKEIRTELSQINDLLEYIDGEDRNWVLSKISEIEKDLRKKKDSSADPFRRHNQQMDSFLAITMDNITNLQEQRQNINRMNKSLDRGSGGISSGIEYLKRLKQRNEGDLKILIGGVVSLILLVVFVSYVF